MPAYYVQAQNSSDAKRIARKIAAGDVPELDHYKIRDLAVAQAKSDNLTLRVPVSVFLVYTMPFFSKGVGEHGAVVKARLPLE